MGSMGPDCQSPDVTVQTAGPLADVVQPHPLGLVCEPVSFVSATLHRSPFTRGGASA